MSMVTFIFAFPSAISGLGVSRPFLPDAVRLFRIRRRGFAASHKPCCAFEQPWASPHVKDGEWSWRLRHALRTLIGRSKGVVRALRAARIGFASQVAWTGAFSTAALPAARSRR